MRGAAEVSRVGIHPEIHRDNRDSWEEWWLHRDASGWNCLGTS